ncbi:MAG TPA: M20/M25/M40 family metallo-hydrolase [Gemmatimonadales bacterium]|nr:M20/M25/M40 family metallo-hydrolase [Gemmatimonadales bacterium]
MPVTASRTVVACLLLTLATVLVPPGARAQQAPGTASSPADSAAARVSATASLASVKAAMEWLDSNEQSQIAEWIRITEIPAPSGFEQRRAEYVKGELEKLGLTVAVDSIGNVTAVRKGTGGGPVLVFAAHMDTVHPEDTDVRVRRSGDTLHAPGIFDNSASVANMLAIARALHESNVRTRGDIVYVATVQEEIGLRGMEYWFNNTDIKTDLLVSLDGGLSSVAYGALGIYWTRYVFTGPGSHTNASAGKPHPVRALSDAVRDIYTIEIPYGQGGAVYNVGMLRGGKIFNAIPEEVSFTMDLRSVNPVLLDSLDREIEQRVARAADTHGVGWRKEVELRNRAGGTEEMLADRRTHPLVETTIAAHEHFGIRLGPVPAVATGSTDGNIGVVLGIPTVAIGRGRGTGSHTLAERALASSVLPATKMAMLLAVTMTGVVQ